MPRIDIRELARQLSKTKDQAISFNTNAEIKNALDKIAEEEGKDVPSVVEAIVYSYLKENKPVKSPDEKHRRHERKPVSFPALIGESHLQHKNLKKGTVLDISHGGIRFAIPKGAEMEIQNEGEPDTFTVIFTLPNYNWPIRLECRSQRVSEFEDEVHVGAIIVNPDCSVCLALQKCLE